MRAWIKQHGLKINDNLRPTLILGRDLRQFHQDRRTKNKHKCLPHEIYCLKCRKPQVPVENMADYLPESETGGRLISLCTVCESLVNKYISLNQIQEIKDKLTITFSEGTKTHNQDE
jgi:hypothetical protein